MTLLIPTISWSLFKIFIQNEIAENSKQSTVNETLFKSIFPQQIFKFTLHFLT